ncbi:hypothetical protein [Janthinobacterium sp. 75]|uniref:hypothetical protein n=1 Tax=Janthinobacterium sp. 75 TaxID=2135628 RepID=UPI00106269F9|nr:hypothetical protein [Janthinobacterium sp. 75]TDY35115.1 hypothetical protein C8C89_2962 [Janthinobacterium sp. 75]
MMSATSSKVIACGSRVAFDSDDGPQAGVVECIKPDVGNGQRIAMVRVAGTLDGMPWQVPVEHLQAASVRA